MIRRLLGSLLTGLRRGVAGRKRIRRRASDLCRGSLAALAFVTMVTMPALAQTDVFAGGVLADNSIVAPVVRWQHELSPQSVVAASLNGWEISGSIEKKSRRRSLVFGAAVTPLHAHSSNRIYHLGVRQRDLEYDNASWEVTAGRVDRMTERWTFDIRGVLLSEDVSGVSAITKDRWSRPYGGLRVTQTYRNVDAENPLLLTAEGFEASLHMESLAGRQQWSRGRAQETFHRRLGNWRIGESATVFIGSSLDVVNRFLVGGSWPVAGVNPLYGYRYGEFRIDRGVSATIEAERRGIGLRWSALSATGARAQGVAIDLTRSWRGIGVRFGAGVPIQSNREGSRVLAYASVLAASFRD